MNTVDPPLRLTTAQREELSDARLVLDTAVHNLQATLKGDDARHAFTAALEMTEQVLATLRRIEKTLK